MVSRGQATADRVRAESERELAAAAQRRDSINAQLANVRQMLATLTGTVPGVVGLSDAPAPSATAPHGDPVTDAVAPSPTRPRPRTASAIRTRRRTAPRTAPRGPDHVPALRNVAVTPPVRRLAGSSGRGVAHPHSGALGCGWGTARAAGQVRRSAAPARPRTPAPEASSALSSCSSTAPTRRQNASGSSAASGFSATIRSTMPRPCRSIARTCWARAISAAWSRSRCTIALAPSGGSGDSHACWAATTRSAGSSASAPPPLPSPSIRHSVGRVEGDQVGQAAGDLAGQPAVLGVGGERGALGVDDRHQRQPELGGQPHPAPGLAQRLGTHRVVGGLAAPVLAEEDARRLAEAHQRDQQPGVALALAGPVEGDDVAGGVPQQPSYAGPVRAPRPGHRVPRVDVRASASSGRRRRPAATPSRGAMQDVERAVEDLRRSPRAATTASMMPRA